MNKKILLGSIVAVVILILVSFTGVVGYQTTKSSTIAKASPLFTIRSSRAIDEESKDLTCDYVGKGNNVVIPFLTRTRTKPIQKFMQRIRTMDDKRFDRFLVLVKSKLINYDNTEMNIFEVTESLKYLRENENLMKNYKINRKDITARCGPTLGLGIFNCPYEFSVKYGDIKFLGLGCFQFIFIVVGMLITLAILLFLNPLPPTLVGCSQTLACRL